MCSVSATAGSIPWKVAKSLFPSGICCVFAPPVLIWHSNSSQCAAAWVCLQVSIDFLAAAFLIYSNATLPKLTSLSSLALDVSSCFYAHESGKQVKSGRWFPQIHQLILECISPTSIFFKVSRPNILFCMLPYPTPHHAAPHLKLGNS